MTTAKLFCLLGAIWLGTSLYGSTAEIEKTKPLKKMVWAWVMVSFPLSYDYSGLRDRPLWPGSGNDLEDCRTMIRAGKQAGLDGFMIQSNPRRNRFEHTLKQWDNWLTAAEELNFKIAFELEMYYSSKSDVTDWLKLTWEKFHDRSAVYKIDGKPVYFLWLRNSMPKTPFDVGRGEGTFPADDWADLLRQVRTAAGGKILFYADMFDSARNGRPGGYTAYEKEKLMPLMDGLWEFGGLHNQIMLNNGPVGRVLDKMQAYFDDAKTAKMNFVAGLIPGFWREEVQWYVNPRGTEYYRTVWDKILKMQPSGVMVQSWNDYSEDAQIQPSVRIGRCLAELTAHYAALYRGTAPEIYSARRIWVSQPQEIYRGEKAYCEFLSLPSRAQRFTVAGQWVDDKGRILDTFHREFDPLALGVEMPELSFAAYGEARAVRIAGTVSATGMPSEKFFSQWIWINGISRFDKFTSRYLLEPGKGSVALSRPESGKFRLEVGSECPGRLSLWRKTARNIGETPAKPERLHVFKSEDSKHDWAQGKIGIELRYFMLEHPDWHMSLSVSQGTLSECRKFGKRIVELKSGAQKISWTSAKLGRIGLAAANSAFDGLDVVWNGSSPEAELTVNVNGVEYRFKAAALESRPAVSLDRDGFLLLRRRIPYSRSESVADQVSGVFTFSLPEDGQRCGEAVWAELELPDGRTLQSFPFTLASSDSVTSTLPTCYYDYAGSKPVASSMARDQALILDWNFNAAAGSLVGDASVYDNFGRFGCVFSSFNVGTQTQKPVWKEGTLLFDGVDDFVALPTGVVPEGAFTIECRIKNRPTGKMQMLVMLGYQLYLKIDPAGFILANVGPYQIKSTRPVGPSMTDIALVYDLSSIRLYIDRVLVGEKKISGSKPILFSGARRLGMDDKGLEPFDGQIDQLRVWAAPISFASSAKNVQ